MKAETGVSGDIVSKWSSWSSWLGDIVIGNGIVSEMYRNRIPREAIFDIHVVGRGWMAQQRQARREQIFIGAAKQWNSGGPLKYRRN